MDTDLELCTFYSTFFRESLKLNKHGNLRKFKKFLKHEHENDSDAKESKVFKVDLYRQKFAYLFENNVFLSSAVAALFKNVLDKNANLLRRLIEREVINICCFSDGTCAEIVAIVQVLFNASQNITSHYRFNVTVICFTRSWKSISLQLLKRLRKYQLLREHVKFIIINLSNELPDEVHQVIRNADIITMVQFLSKIRNCTRRFSEVYKDIFRHLKPESIVFFLDCADQNFFYGINRQLSSCLRLYYKLGYLHVLNLETVKNSFKPFDDAFENYFFVKFQKICFGFWINIGLILDSGVNGAISKNYIERGSCMKSINIFHGDKLQYFNEKDDRFVESSPKKFSIFEDKEEKNRQNKVSSLEYVTLPQHYPKKKKKGKAKAKKKEKANKQTTHPKKGKKKKEVEVLPLSENLKFEFINEDFSVTTLAADYANTLLTKVNLIMREDIEENRGFLKTVKVRHKRFSASTDTDFDYFRYGDDGLDSFAPAFNQSSPKNQRWDFWWRKWNWV